MRGARLSEFLVGKPLKPHPPFETQFFGGASWGGGSMTPLFAGGGGAKITNVLVFFLSKKLFRVSTPYRANSNILPKYLIPECFFLSATKKKQETQIILPFGTQDFAKKKIG